MQIISDPQPPHAVYALTNVQQRCDLPQCLQRASWQGHDEVGAVTIRCAQHRISGAEIPIRYRTSAQELAGPLS